MEDKTESNFEEIEYEQELKNVSEIITKRKPNKFPLLFIIFIFLIIGLPVWFKTTTPERWNLPNVSLLSEKVKSIKHHFKISVVFFEKDDVLEIRNYFAQQVLKNSHKYDLLRFDTEYNVRHAFQRELDLFQKWKSYNKKSNSIHDSYNISSLSEFYENNHLIFYVLPSSIGTQNIIHSGRHGNFFIDSNHIPSLSFHSDLFSLVNEKVQVIQQLSESFYLNLNKNDQSNLLLLGREFEFVFDILIDDENLLFHNKTREEILLIRDQVNTRINENFQKLINLFYSGLSNISLFFKVNFVSQIIHYALPDNFISSNLIKNSSNKYLEVSKIQKMFDYVESKRIDHGNENAYHVILLMTNESKLKFLDSGIESIVVTTPFRGAIIIDNDDNTLQGAFEQFLCQFFHLNEFGKYSLESIVRSIAQKQIMKTLQSLEATEKLLKTVGNIVIQEKIAKRMYQSFNDALTASIMLEDGKDILTIFDKSHSAYALSEKAFYDPSLLSLLYFPEDQKYAIYLPLFLPICLPILINIYKVFKREREAKKIKTD